MTAPRPEEANRLLLLGEDEARYGAFRLEVLPSAQVACALSVGADPKSPALLSKGEANVPNEDALLVVEDGDRVLLAVADAHFGRLASHVLLRQLRDVVQEVPGNPAALMRAIGELGPPGPDEGSRSETTLLVAVLRREMGAGFGFSYGDSTCAVVGGAHRGQALNRRTQMYVNPYEPASLAREHAAFFEFDVEPGALLLAFSDGIDECHYRAPATSVGPEMLRALFEEVGAVAEAYAEALTRAALEGLPGYPGGQDNVALIAAAT